MQYMVSYVTLASGPIIYSPEDSYTALVEIIIYFQRNVLVMQFA